MATLDIHLFPCLDDNYGVLIHDPSSGATASIDAPDADDVRAALAQKGWKLTHILTTHHHHDHTGGNVELKAESGCMIIGPKGEAAKVPGIDQAVGEGDKFKLGGFEVNVIETPGHTLGHVTYHIPAANVAFAGDTLFALGCGRIFEGTPEMMFNALQKLAALPGDTVVYCGHEYTAANARFALTIEPGNQALQQRMKEIEALRAAGQPTVPTTIAAELSTNPFLRAHVPAIQRQLDMVGAPTWQVFAEIRERKNRG
ncbi:MAG TPA: hydroxyacylglutathione hydrolase [Hyphomicrobiaceae bacterium]|nr:hydroxyacylglutathione hydrolase [Hyphomicrobiaceae bacterium]